jgi:transcriptional regulator with GAF, ATPase, and Fis domain
MQPALEDVLSPKPRPKPAVRVSEMVGESRCMMRLHEIIDKVAPTGARVLIMGANGSGKELVAQWVHEKSSRRDGPFVEVNCAAIPSELIESELFGHEKGAFTSAIKQRKGKFEQAHGGTLFLDEIGDMSLAAQAKVLRVLQEHKITRVGSDRDIDVDVRVIAATNKNVPREIDKGEFREDLFHRLSVIIIRVPPLCDRLDDIPLLVESFLRTLCDFYKLPLKTISADALEQLQTQPWTGNIRELRNVVERLVILCDDEITREDVVMYGNGLE